MSEADLNRASREIDANTDSYLKAERYYDGIGNEEWMADQLSNITSGRDFTGTLNYASIPVDAVADRMQLLAIKGPTDDVTEKIQELWSTNKMSTRFPQFVLDVLKKGDNFMSVWPIGTDFEDEPIGLDDLDMSTPASWRARMLFADPTTTRAFYDDAGDLAFVARKWQETLADGKLYDRVDLYYTDTIEKYYRIHSNFAQEDDRWEQLVDESGEWPLENPFGQIPFFHFPTAFPHGRPEHYSLYGVQDAINKIFQIHIASIEFLGFPIIYALLDELSSSGTSDFEYSPIDDDNSDEQQVNRLNASPGEVWALRAKKVDQLQPSGSTSFIESLKQYKEIASEICGLPARLFSSTDGQHPGADAVNAADAVLRQRVFDRQLMVAAALRQAISFALKLAYGIEVDPEDIFIQWQPQKIEIDANVIAAMEFKRSLGVTDRQLLNEMGYTPQEIDAFLGEGVERIVPAPVEEKLPGESAREKNSGSSNDLPPGS